MQEEVQVSLEQLQIYVRDVKESYEAEKERRRQLEAAVGELDTAYRSTVLALAAAVEAKDKYTAGHLKRVTAYGLIMLRSIAPDEVEDPQYGYGFLLHDIGKIGVPDSVLGKPGKLTDDEWVHMKRHPEIGRKVLEGIPFLSRASEIVFSHHEMWDGGGYPVGLSGEQICLGARIFPVADAFDAMTSDRVYRKALPTEVAFERLIAASGSQFWPDAVEAFVKADRDEVTSIIGSET